MGTHWVHLGYVLSGTGVSTRGTGYNNSIRPNVLTFAHLMYGRYERGTLGGSTPEVGEV